jgi:DNA-binding MarR family transcriptional regulator
MHKISRFTTYVYSTVHKNIKQLVKMDLIELQKLGRVQKISYTLKGIKLYGHLIEISKILNGGK